MNIFCRRLPIGIMVGGILCTDRYEPDSDFRSYEDYQFLQGELLMLGMYISFVLFDQCGLDPLWQSPLWRW